MTVSTRLSQSVLYAFGAFFCYPWKPAFQFVYGSPYKIAYQHFRRDHSDAVNIAMHFICLGFQLLASFGLLFKFAEHHALPLLPVVSVGTWLASLLTTPCPLSVKTGTLLSVAAAYQTAPAFEGAQLEQLSLIGFVIVFFVQAVAMGEDRISFKDGLWMFGIFAAWLLATHLLTTFAAGILEEYVTELSCGFVLLMLCIGGSGYPVIPCAVTGAIGCRILAIVTSQPMMYLYGCAFIGSLLQGVAHLMTREKPTLVAHQNAFKDKDAKVAFEWAHVVYFPNLIFHSMLESFTA
eukprot:gene24192-29374_t